jgi:DNA-binding transcriptional regulator YiaG
MAPQSGRMVCRFTRKKAGLSQVKFASALGVSVKKVSAWEHGKAVPDEAETEKIRGMGK